MLLIKSRRERRGFNPNFPVKDLKNSQKAQIRPLIGILGTALLGTVIGYIVLPLPPRS